MLILFPFPCPFAGAYTARKSAEPISQVASDMAKTVFELYPTLTVKSSVIVEVS
jgi:hypothetical protein